MVTPMAAVPPKDVSPENSAHGKQASTRARRTTRTTAAYRLPPKLRAGDTVALFSPSSHSGEEGPRLQRAGREILEGWGLRPLPQGEAAPSHLYLAGSDAARAREFESLYCDPGVNGLFATRGGYGAARMLPHLDTGRIRAAGPKPVVGMSDVCALFTFLHQTAGVAAIHGPCLAGPGDRASPHWENNLEELRGILFGEILQPVYPCRYLNTGSAPAPEVSGPLLGGNLAVLAASLGTPWAIDTRGGILFLEDVNEAPYRIDRYLNQLRQAGRLDSLAGVVFGQLIDCEGSQPGTLEQVLMDYFRDAPYPAAMGLEAGHGQVNRTLVLGGTVRLSPAGAPEQGEARLHAVL